MGESTSNLWVPSQNGVTKKTVGQGEVPIGVTVQTKLVESINPHQKLVYPRIYSWTTKGKIIDVLIKRHFSSTYRHTHRIYTQKK